MRAGTLLVEEVKALALKMILEGNILLVKEILGSAGDIEPRLFLVPGERVNEVEKVLV